MPKTTHNNHEELVANLKIRENVLILGPTASGKTKGIQVAAAELQLPIYIKVVGAQSTEASLMGFNNAAGNYTEGIAYKPFTEGGILLIDEIDNGNANVNLTLNALADGKAAFPCGMKERHPDFCLIATANTIHGATIEYCGRNRQDAALMNRFIFMKWNYDEELERDIAIEEYQKHGGTNLAEINIVVNEIVKFRNEVKELKLNHIISPRTTLQAARKLALNRPKTEIMLSVILKSLDVDSAKKLMNKVENSTLVETALEEELNELKKKYPERYAPKFTPPKKETQEKEEIIIPDKNKMEYYEPGNMPQQKATRMPHKKAESKLPSNPFEAAEENREFQKEAIKKIEE